MACPVSVSTPFTASHDPVIPFEFVNARTSSEALNPEEIVIVAASRLLLSLSLIVSESSMTVGPCFSMKFRVLPEPPRMGLPDGVTLKVMVLAD